MYVKLCCNVHLASAPMCTVVQDANPQISPNVDVGTAASIVQYSSHTHLSMDLDRHIQPSPCAEEHAQG